MGKINKTIIIQKISLKNDKIIKCSNSIISFHFNLIFIHKLLSTTQGFDDVSFIHSYIQYIYFIDLQFCCVYFIVMFIIVF